MLTVEQIQEYLERVIAEDKLSGNRAGLKNAQVSAGFLMAAANYAGDKELTRLFQVLAARAANSLEEVNSKH